MSVTINPKCWKLLVILQDDCIYNCKRCCKCVHYHWDVQMNINCDLICPWIDCNFISILHRTNRLHYYNGLLISFCSHMSHHTEWMLSFPSYQSETSRDLMRANTRAKLLMRLEINNRTLMFKVGCNIKLQTFYDAVVVFVSTYMKVR